jgi:SAM-dependent methyltransferase
MGTVEPGDDDRSRRLLRLFMGPWLARAAAAACELGVVDRIGAGFASCAEIAADLDLHPDHLLRLLRLLAGLDLVREERDRFELTPTGRLLRTEDPSSLRDLGLLYTSDLFLGAWGGLAAAVRTGDQAFRAVHGRDVFSHLADHPDDAALFHAGMSVGSSFAAGLPDAVDLSAARRVVDVGGGDGSRLAEVLRAHPHLHGVLFERPDVLPAAERRLAPYVAEGRCTAIGGDFLREVPAGGDVYVLCRVLHNWDDASCRALLANCRAAMRPDGRLLVVERVIPDGAHPWLSLAFDVQMMVMTAGRERTAAEYDALLRPAGLHTREIRDLAAEMRVLVAAPA